MLSLGLIGAVAVAAPPSVKSWLPAAHQLGRDALVAHDEAGLHRGVPGLKRA